MLLLSFQLIRLWGSDSDWFWGGASSSGKKSKARGAGGDDLLDSSDADSVGSSSTALSDLSISYATENVNSHEFVLDKYIDALYEKRWGSSVAFLYLCHHLQQSMPNVCYANRWVVTGVVW